MMSLTPIPNPLEWGGRDEWDGEERVVLLYNLYPATASIWRLADVCCQTATWFWEYFVFCSYVKS